MEMSQLYDEDLFENSFFQQFCDMCSSLFQAAVENEWLICVPKIGTFESHKLTEQDCMSHVLIGLDSGQYRTASDKRISINEKVISLGEGFENQTQVKVLFSETFYADTQKKYQVWCVDRPLSFECSTPSPSLQAQSAGFRILNVEDSVELLFTGHRCSLKKSIDKMISTHKSALCFSDNKTASLRDQIDTMHSLFTKCLQACSKDSQLKRRMSLNRHISDNLRISVEIYINHRLYNDLFKYVCTAVAGEDAKLNKINRNLSQIQLKDFGIVSEFSCNLPRARRELLTFTSYTTPLAKMASIKRVIFALMQSPRNAQEIEPLTADDLIPMLVFLIVRSSIPTWTANFEYMTQFHFSKSALDEYSFYLSTLEAALFYIKSGELNKILTADKSTDLVMSHSRSGSSPVPKVSQMDELFEHIRCGDIEAVRSIIEDTTGGNKGSSAKVCHPLCSCDLCERQRDEEGMSPRANVTVFSRDDRGFTAMHQAALFGQADLIEYLKNCGSVVSATDYHSSTPLHIACQKGHQSAVMMLIDCDTDVNATDNDGNKPLHMATLNGHEDCIKALLYQSRLNTLDINAANENGDTALHIAAKWSYESITDLLLEHGAWPEARNRRNATPMMLVSHGGIAQLLTVAIEIAQERANDGFIEVSEIKGAQQPSYKFSDVIPPLGLKPPNQLTEDKVSSKVQNFLRAVSDSDIEMMKHLMGWAEPHDYCDVSDDDLEDKELCHPLCQCRRCAPTQRMQASLVDINAGDEQGRTALHIAVEKSNIDIINMLLQKHADVNSKTNLVQFTSLHLACQQLTPDKQMVDILLTHGAKVNCKDCNGRTPLHFSSQTGSVLITQLLLESKANVDSTNIRGNTPLHEACKVNNTEIVQLLVEWRSNPTLTNRTGLTAIQLTSNPNIIRIVTAALDQWRERQTAEVPHLTGVSCSPAVLQPAADGHSRDMPTLEKQMSDRQHLFAALETDDVDKLQQLFSSISSFNRKSLKRTITRDRSTLLLNVASMFPQAEVSSQSNITDMNSGKLGNSEETLTDKELTSNLNSNSEALPNIQPAEVQCETAETLTAGQSVADETLATRQSVAGETLTTGQSVAGETLTTGQSVAGETLTTGQSVAGETLTTGQSVAGETLTTGQSVAGETLTIGQSVAGEPLTTRQSVAGEPLTTGQSVAGETLTTGQSVAGETLTTGQSVADEPLATGQSVAGETLTTGQSMAGETLTTRQSVAGETPTVGQSPVTNTGIVPEYTKEPECDLHQLQCNESDCENSETESADERILCG